MIRPTITWRREDGEKIRMCEHQFSETEDCEEVAEHTGDTLTLININRHVVIRSDKTQSGSMSRFQSGNYLCIAKNGVPPVVSKRVQLYVDFPPTLWITHQLVIMIMIVTSDPLDYTPAIMIMIVISDPLNYNQFGDDDNDNDA